MEFVKDLNDAKYMVPGKERGAEEMLHLYIYNYMKKRGLDEVAKTFAERANIQMAGLDNDDSVLTDWWGVFWLQISSKMKQPGGNPESSAQLSANGTLDDILASLKRTEVGTSQAPPSEKPLQHVNNVVGQPPEGWFQSPPEDNQRRAGKRPITDTTSILGDSAARQKGSGPLGFPLVQLLPSEVTSVLHPDKSSHLHMPGTIQPPPQVVGAFRSVQVQPTYPTGQNLAYPPAATIAVGGQSTILQRTSCSGENNWKNQGSLTGVRVNASDGPDPDSFMSRVPAAFSELMMQEAEERQWRSKQQRHY